MTYFNPHSEALFKDAKPHWTKTMKRSIEELRGAAFRRIAKALREFGYPRVTHQDVAQWHSDWLEGKEAIDVCAKISVGHFEEPDAKALFGSPADQPPPQGE